MNLRLWVLGGGLRRWEIVESFGKKGFARVLENGVREEEMAIFSV